jgi:hypothetical protein
MADAARALIDALDPQQRKQVCLPFDGPRLPGGHDRPGDLDDGPGAGQPERRRWFYTPTDHGGLPLAAMTSAQHRLVHQLVATGLSRPGYVTAALIIGQDNILDQLEGFTIGFGRERGRDPLLFWVAIFGEPGETGSWGWRFGGHHLSLNFTIKNGEVVSTTPCFFGADPAAAPLLGPHLHRPLGGAEDLGRELARSLTPEQLALGLVTSAPPTDIVTSNRTLIGDRDRPLPLTELWRGTFEGEIEQLLIGLDATTAEAVGLNEEHLTAVAYTTRPKGVPATALAPEQQELLRALLDVYVGRVCDDVADREASKYAGAAVEDLYFLWAGGLELGQPHYYRVQGSQLLVEYDNAQRYGNHVHTVWRDLTLDFGGDPLAEHYVSAHR